jgi:hypothetical protein
LFGSGEEQIGDANFLIHEGFNFAAEAGATGAVALGDTVVIRSFRLGQANAVDVVSALFFVRFGTHSGVIVTQSKYAMSYLMSILKVKLF